jgi:hypothetical protein
LDYQGENGGIYCTDSVQQVFNPQDFQVWSCFPWLLLVYFSCFVFTLWNFSKMHFKLRLNIYKNLENIIFGVSEIAFSLISLCIISFVVKKKNL